MNLPERNITEAIQEYGDKFGLKYGLNLTTVNKLKRLATRAGNPEIISPNFLLGPEADKLVIFEEDSRPILGAGSLKTIRAKIKQHDNKTKSGKSR